MELLNDKNYIPQVAVDCVVFGYEDHQLKVLISNLNYKGNFYTLHSGFIDQEEDLENAAKRVLKDRTGLNNIYLQQFKVFDTAEKKRKEFMDTLIETNYSGDVSQLESSKEQYNWFVKRFISIGYYALVDLKTVSPKLTKFDASIKWYSVGEIPKLVMHYDEVFEAALRSMKKDIGQKFNAFNLLPEKFTMKDIQHIYEAIFQTKYIRSNFQKKILEMDVLERLEKKYTGAKNKAPYLYRLKG